MNSLKSIDFNRFKAPDSIKDAESRALVLTFDLEEIGNQLSNPNRRKLYPDEASYHEWRAKALEAVRLKKAEIRWLEAWLAKGRPEVKDISAGGLLLASLPILNTAIQSGVVPEPHRAIVYAVREYLRASNPDLGALVTGTINQQGGPNA
jgi:hypothetical protein